MIREDRGLLAELARLNGDMTSLALRIIEGSAGAGEQERYALRLIAAGERLRRRADEMNRAAIDGEVLSDKAIALPAYTVEDDWEPEWCAEGDTKCKAPGIGLASWHRPRP